VAPVPAFAESVGDFYAGRNMTMLVGYEAGSGNDILARLFARYFRTHLAGTPVMVVQNMPGVAGLKAANYLYNVSPKDGSVIGEIGRNIPLAPILDTGNAQFDPLQFTWLGSLSKVVSVAIVWHSSAVKTLADAKRAEVIVGAPAASSEAARLPHLYNGTLGTRFKVVTGYPEPQIELAMERGELAGLAGLSLDSLLSTNGDWLRDKKINILVQSGFQADSRIPGVPLAIDQAQTQQDRELLQTMFLPYEIARPFAAPPGVPADRARALADALMDTVHDGEFLKDAARANIDVVVPASAEKTLDFIRRIYQAPPSVIARAKSLLGMD
jgi:tripartite-type tricarboxylate transporter receptor subunit TctC